MERLIKNSGVFLCALAFVFSLTGCGQDNQTVASVVNAIDADAVSVLQNIRTTQYFTDEAVAQKDIETIVQAGINAPSAMNGQPWHFSVITDAEVLQQISEGMGSGIGFGGRPQGAPDGEMDLPEGMTPPEGMEGGRPEGMQPPEGFVPEGNLPEGMAFPGGEMPEGMSFPEGMEFPDGNRPAAPSGSFGGMSKAGITDAPLVIVISCKAGSELDAGLACQNMSGAAQLLGYGTKIVTSPTMALNGSNQDTYQELLGIPDGYSAAAILLIGHEDTSVDKNVDSYTGATNRNPVNDMVTYVTVD